MQFITDLKFNGFTENLKVINLCMHFSNNLSESQIVDTFTMAIMLLSIQAILELDLMYEIWDGFYMCK